jgi:hypothetical protein
VNTRSIRDLRVAVTTRGGFVAVIAHISQRAIGKEASAASKIFLSDDFSARFKLGCGGRHFGNIGTFDDVKRWH